MRAEDLCEMDKRLGAEDVVPFKIEDIVFDPRTLLKCMFGCADWGHHHTCPSRPGALKPWEYRQILEHYSWGVILHAHKRRPSQEVSYALEREAFLNGHYFALSLSDCGLCEECAGWRGEPCVDPKKARPAFHSVGIDVYKTVHRFGLPLETLRSEDEERNWYSAVFVE